MRFFYFPVLIAIAGICSGCCGKKGPADTFKVVSCNIRYDNVHDGENRWELRREAMVEMLCTERCDLVGMQEVLAGQYDFLRENMEGYGFAGVGRDDGLRGGEMMAIAYRKERFDKLEEGHFWLSETPEEVSLGWDGACNRMVSWLRLEDKTAGREIYFFNTHLDHQGTAARTEGASLVASKIKAITRGAPFVLTGDFNAPPDDPVLEGLRASFPSARDRAPETDSRDTFNGFGMYQGSVIDHIYYGGLVPTLFRTLDGDYGVRYISDHYPVEAVFVYEE
ncbi:MAG: endonuclease/exonuclease/phosphatase family protein [Rikenellaceae bacterium]|nr:endonuclease/exonuclease/phosphatase family protein [Rikenellaceae bacterium]